MADRRDSAQGTPAAQLRTHIEKFDPERQRLIRAVRSAVRKRLPAATEFVYDYDTFFVIAYSTTDRSTDGIVSIAARPDGVRLYFMPGPQLPDPKKLLMGSGKQARYIRVEAASQLAHPDVEVLFAATIGLARVPLASEGRGRLIIQTDASKRRPRRKPAT
jgi:hypothetical protein